MKLISTCIFLLFAFLGLGQMSNLELTVTNFDENKGQLIISIFDDPKGFPEKGKEWKRIYIDKIHKEGTSISIEIPKGDYAIALFHDLNLDGKCNFNFIGIPTEAYGFSQNIRPIISIPSFEDTMFHVDGTESIEIKLIQ